jgi:anaerobic ribonucleoside-triphosphate reductase activating protein
MSRETWPPGGGESIATDRLACIIEGFFESGRADGLTVSGGEPFDQPEALMRLLRSLNVAGVRDILVFSGYKMENIALRHPGVSGLVAAIIDGPFELGGETEACWKGSANQAMTLFRPELSEIYGAWAEAKKGALQVLARGREKFIAGIPRQGDADRIRESIARP